MEYTDHDVVCTSHGDHLGIDQAVSRFVYSEKNVYYLRIRTIILRAAMAAYTEQETHDLNGAEEKTERIGWEGGFPWVERGGPLLFIKILIIFWIDLMGIQI